MTFNLEAGKAFFESLPKYEEDPKFTLWMKDVNRFILKETGVGADDLPDYCYRDDWEDGMTAKRVAKRAIKAAKEF